MLCEPKSMPTINLTNNTTLNITASSSDGNATLNRYLKNPLVFLTPSGFEAIANTKIGALDPAPFPLTAAATGAGQFAAKGNVLGIQLGASASLGLLTGADKADLLSALEIDAAPGVDSLVSFAIQGTLSAAPTVTVSDFSFGISKGATVALTSLSPAAGTDAFSDAVKRAITGFTIPHDLDDLRSLPADLICELDASSSLQFTASITYNFLNDPLATLSISKLPSIAISATAEATLEATVTHTADHTVTIAKLPDGRLHLAVSLTNTDDFETSLTLSAGATAKIGNFDALAFLLGRISPNASVELAKIASDMPTGKARQLSAGIKAAIEAAMSKSLEVSLKEALDNTKSANRLFLYEIDLTALDGASSTALQSALTGDFTTITKPGAALAGVRELDSALTVTSSVTHSLALHLLGIFNWEDTNTFIENSVVDFTKDTHEIVLSDETIKIATNNLNAEKLREVLVKGITLTLPASANTPAAKAPISIVYFDRKADAQPSVMRQFVNVLQVTGASSAGAAKSLLSRNLPNYGSSSLYLGLSLNQTQCRQIFIDGDGKPYDWLHYLHYACNAAAIILDGDGDTANANRVRLFRAGDSFWQQLRDAGAAPNQMGLLTNAGIIPGADVDVITFIWWSSAMEAYAKALASGKSLVGVGKQVVKDSTQGFSEPWLVLAIWEMLGNPPIESLFTSSLIKAGT
jgi:hypothetical protein